MHPQLIVSGDETMLDFIVLGLIPGTNISIGFYVYLALLVAGIAYGIHSYNKIHKHHKQTKAKADHINRIAI